MRNWILKIQQFAAKYLMPQDTAIGIVSLLASFLTTFAAIFYLSDKLYDRLPDYPEFIAGLTTFSAYPKQADLQVIRYALIGVFVLYWLFVLAFNIWSANFTMDKRISMCFTVIYFATLFCIFRQKEFVWDMILLLCTGVLLAIPVFWREVGKTGTFISLILILLFMEYSFYAVYGIVNAKLGLSLVPFLLFKAGRLVILAIVVTIGFLHRFKKERVPLDKVLAFSQVLLPLGLLNFYHFDYQYEAAQDTVRLFETGRYHLFVWICLAAMTGHEAFCMYRRKYNVMPTSIMMIGMMKVYTLPKAVMNIDFFHNGEITVPMQQFMSYGKLPYRDLIPIHGLCDYFYGAIDYLLFDGSYLSLNASTVVGELLMICLLSIVLWFALEKKEQATLVIYLFSGFLIHTAGLRYLMLFCMFFILFSDKVRESFLIYFWWWVFLSIVAIAWNPSIGGSGAIAFLPVVLYRIYRDSYKEVVELFDKENKSTKKLVLFGVRYGFLLLFGLSFIPLFLGIVVYLKENAATTLLTNGMGMIGNFTKLQEYFVPGLTTTTDGFYLKTFLLLLPLLLCFAGNLYGKEKQYLQRKGREYAVCLFVCFYVILNYAFVRYDNGLRTGVVGLFFTILVLFFLLDGKGHERVRSQSELTLFFIILLVCLYQMDGRIGIDKEQLGEKGYVAATQQTEIMGNMVEDPIVYVTGESVNIPNLGNGFISGNALNSLKNIDAVVDGVLGEKGSYVDLTNAIANYVIFDKASVLDYTSGYNISNELMQENAIRQIEEEQPQLILLAPFIRFDDASISLRCGKLYDHIRKAGYRPYSYGNVIYLLKNAEPAAGSEEAFEAYADLMHKEVMQYLPAVWGNAGLVQKLEESGENVQKHLTVPDLMEVEFEQPVKGEEISYIEILTQGDEKALTKRLEEYDELTKGARTDMEKKQKEIDLGQIDHLTVSFVSDATGKEETYHFAAYLYGDRYLIPVKSSPYWTDGRIRGFEVKLESEDPDVQLADAILYKE
ncbi:MAG: hypothetical protein E7294_09510 [Lachnospiraceae bacterium]|nr:hypothetical protein [Lachnospiraceae bacterium]